LITSLSIGSGDGAITFDPSSEPSSRVVMVKFRIVRVGRKAALKMLLGAKYCPFCADMGCCQFLHVTMHFADVQLSDTFHRQNRDECMLIGLVKIKFLLSQRRAQGGDGAISRGTAVGYWNSLCQLG
jgi:hypothetical protein